MFFVKTPVTVGIIKLLMALGSGELSRQEIQDKLKLKDRRLFMSNYINIALEDKYIEMRASFYRNVNFPKDIL